MDSKDSIIRWVNTVLNELPELKGNKGIDILNACGAECAKTSLLLKGAEKIRKTYANEMDNDKLYNIYKSEYYDTPRLTKQGNKITLIFKDCTCPLVKEGIDNSYLCNCTVGYTKKIFETLFNQKVDIELKQSILKGGKVCEQVIYIA